MLACACSDGLDSVISAFTCSECEVQIWCIFEVCVKMAEVNVG